MLHLHIGYYIDRLMYYKSTLDPDSVEYLAVIYALQHATESLRYYQHTDHYKENSEYERIRQPDQPHT
ncbi:hypothetical protein [Nostoc sp. CENA543]|uniref:hypothetical protein n=1 Tax=Nostoc sp. CENA543 TaxID=1869241 RepID=UPI001CEF6135|nr:hypothetical protein [Nostoc sp. CENA543]